jgi:hypothetical protein
MVPIPGAYDESPAVMPRICCVEVADPTAQRTQRPISRILGRPKVPG